MRAPVEADRDPNKHWLGEVQPTGIVVTASALAAHALVPAQQTRVDTEAVLAHLNDRDKASPALCDPWAFLSDILDWRVTQVAGSPGGPDIPDALRVSLSASETVLEPHLAVAAPGGHGWQLVVRTEAPGVEPDKRGHQRFFGFSRSTCSRHSMPARTISTVDAEYAAALSRAPTEDGVIGVVVVMENYSGVGVGTA
jgi:hypothetical protein